MHNVDRLRTDNFSIIIQLNFNFTNFTIGSEYAVNDRTEASICQSPAGFRGNLRLGTGKISSKCVHLDSGIRHIIIVICLQICIIELTGRRSGRDKDNTVRVLTERTVAGRAIDLQFFARALGHKGGGTAAVAVCSVYASCCDHNFRTFVHIHTKRKRSLTPVVHHDNDGAVCLNTYNGTCRRIGAVRGFVLIDAIFYDVT